MITPIRVSVDATGKARGRARATWRTPFIALAVLLGLACGLVAEASAQTSWRSRRGKKYTVKIDSAPQQAAIYLDDKQYGIVGYTPWTGKLAKGDYRLIIELQGYKPAQQFITVGPRSKQFFVPLEKQIQPATIDIQTGADPNVAGASIFIDAQPEGTAPGTVSVPAGRHQIVVKKAGFEDYSQWVTVKEGERLTITPVLKAVVVEKKGSLLIDADVPDAEVSVDGKPLADKTPTLVDGLDEGVHVVEVRKAPATPWKQTVYVKANERTKVVATLAATMVTGGNVRVLSNVEGAEVYLDGENKGKAPIDLKDVPTGMHIIEVRAKGYQTKEERVTVNAGSATVLKLDLSKEVDATPATGKVKIVSPVAEAKVFIDGAPHGNAPVEKELSPGEHFIVLEKPGYARFEQKIRIEAGQTFTVTADLKAVGALRFLSNVAGAEVVIDGESVGRTPLVKEDIAVGEHVITIRMPGYFDFEQNVRVEGGKLGIINADLKLIDTGPTALDLERIRKGLSSFGGRTIPYGNFAIDLAVGYPYIINAKATTGARKDLDIGVGFRSYTTTWEFLVTGRYALLDQDPFAVAGFATVGGGGGFSGRNEFTFQAGVAASILFSNIVSLTGRTYLDVWSDRLCGSPAAGSMFPDSGPSVCQGKASAAEVMRAGALMDKGSMLTDATELQDRDNGARLYLSLVVEASVIEHGGVYFIFEGAPFQGERAAHTDVFNAIMADEDPIYNLQGGVTLKF